MAPLAPAERVLFDADGAGNGPRAGTARGHRSIAGQGASRRTSAESA
jgi:hypothetical protein